MGAPTSRWPRLSADFDQIAVAARVTLLYTERLVSIEQQRIAPGYGRINQEFILARRHQY
jgi:hypothetical protein